MAKFKTSIAGLLFSAILVLGGSQANAIVVTSDTVAAFLATALLASGTGISVTSSSLSGFTSGALTSSGTYTNASGTYGIGAGVILSSGAVGDFADGPNTSPG